MPSSRSLIIWIELLNGACIQCGQHWNRARGALPCETSSVCLYPRLSSQVCRIEAFGSPLNLFCTEFLNIGSSYDLEPTSKESEASQFDCFFMCVTAELFSRWTDSHFICKLMFLVSMQSPSRFSFIKIWWPLVFELSLITKKPQSQQISMTATCFQLTVMTESVYRHQISSLWVV